MKGPRIYRSGCLKWVIKFILLLWVSSFLEFNNRFIIDQGFYNFMIRSTELISYWVQMFLIIFCQFVEYGNGNLGNFLQCKEVFAQQHKSDRCNSLKNYNQNWNDFQITAYLICLKMFWQLPYIIYLRIHWLLDFVNPDDDKVW